MEQDMVVSMIQETSEKRIKVSTIISDDETTSMSRLRQSISPNIEKIKPHQEKILISVQSSENAQILDVKSDSLSGEVLQLSTSSESGYPTRNCRRIRCT